MEVNPNKILFTHFGFFKYTFCIFSMFVYTKHDFLLHEIRDPAIHFHLFDLDM